MTSIDYSIVVPVFRGAKTLQELCGRVVSLFEGRSERFEIILVDDGSSDGSWQVAEQLAANDSRIKGVRLARNFGQHNATACGFRCAVGRFVVTIDEDLQNPPEQIEKLIECRERLDADVVYGIPQRRSSPLWRRIGSRLAMAIPRLVMQIGFDISAFRLIRGEIAREVANSTRHDIIVDAHLSWFTDRIVSASVRHDAPARPSTYHLFSLLSMFAKMLCNYTTLPLRAATTIGILLSVGAILLGIAFAMLRLTGYTNTPGYSSLIVSILFSSGIVLLGIGVMSEYLSRIFLEINQRPQSYVRSTTSEFEPACLASNSPVEQTRLEFPRLSSEAVSSRRAA